MATKFIITALLILTGYTQALAQAKLGNNANTLHPAAVLEMESTNKGVLMPRMTFLQMVAIPQPDPWLMVTCTNCSPAGLYNYISPSWISVNSNTFSQPVYTGGTINCNNGALNGIYKEGTPMNITNTKTIYINITTPGSYVVASSGGNGVIFKGNGNHTTLGTNAIVLTASGTPSGPGTYPYSVTFGGQTCSFNVTYLPLLNVNCGGITFVQSPAGRLIQNTTYTGSVTIPYTTGNGSSYPAVSYTQDGLTITRPAGTYVAGGGTVVYTMSGTFTGTTNSGVYYPSAECDGAVHFGDAIRNALVTAGCASCPGYDNVSSGWIKVTAAEYNSVAGLIGAGKYVTSDANMSLATTTPPNFGSTPVTIAPQPTIAIPNNNYLLGFSTVTGSAAGTTIGAVVMLTDFNVYFPNNSINGNYTDYVGTMPNVTFLANTRYYFIHKQFALVPGFIGYSPVTDPALASYMAIYTGNNNNFCGAVSTGSTQSYFDFFSQTYVTAPQNYRFMQQLLMTPTRQW